MKRQKPRRVVLGTGWLYAQLGNPTWISLRRDDPKLPSPRLLGFIVQIRLRVKGTNLRRVRLVAEVLN
jgi:hypothetical protein